MDPDSAEAAASAASIGEAGEAAPANASSNQAVPNSVANLLSQAFNGESTVGSPLKKQRADDETPDRSINFPSALGDVLGRATADQQKKQAQTATQSTAQAIVKGDEDEEL